MFILFPMKINQRKYIYPVDGLKATRHYNIKDFDCTLFFLQSPSLHQSLQFSFLKAKYTGCPKKNALLSLKAYNSGLEASIGASWDSFVILRL